MVNYGGLLQPPKQPWKCCVRAQLRCSGREGTGEKGGLGWRSGNSTAGAAAAALPLPPHDSLFPPHACAFACSPDMTPSEPPIRHINCLLVDHRVGCASKCNKQTGMGGVGNSGPIPPVFEPFSSRRRGAGSREQKKVENSARLFSTQLFQI